MSSVRIIGTQPGTRLVSIDGEPHCVITTQKSLDYALGSAEIWVGASLTTRSANPTSTRHRGHWTPLDLERVYYGDLPAGLFEYAEEVWIVGVELKS